MADRIEGLPLAGPSWLNQIAQDNDGNNWLCIVFPFKFEACYRWIRVEEGGY